MRRIRISEISIPVPEGKRPVSPVRIVIFGDLHDRMFGEANSNLADVIRRQYPDFVLSVGDLSTCQNKRKQNFHDLEALLRKIACECPVFCVNGNHETAMHLVDPAGYAGMKNNFRKCGVTLLENASVSLEIKGMTIDLYGLELPLKYYARFRNSKLFPDGVRRLIGEPGKEDYTILLSHHPAFFESYALWGADLTFSGHFHGGSVRLPWIGGVVSPQPALFPKYDAGHFRKYGKNLVVTAGLGTHSFLPRIFNPPEIVVVELQ